MTKNLIQPRTNAGYLCSATTVKASLPLSMLLISLSISPFASAFDLFPLPILDETVLDDLIPLEDLFSDTDGDGIFDLIDICPGHDDFLDVNNNGIPDGCEELPVQEPDEEDETSVVTTCQLYAVQDNDLNDSQFFTVSATTLETADLGPLHMGKDIEALDIEPATKIMYAASGDDTDAPGYLYTVDELGQLTVVGSTPFDEIEALSFRPGDGTLWAWAKGAGLITLDPVNPANHQMVIPSEVAIEALTWNTDGSQLYAAQDTHLWAYDGKNIEEACELPGHTEALEMFADDTLLLGLHGKKAVLQFKLLDLTTCEMTEVADIQTGYNDVEGIAWFCDDANTPPPTDSSCIENNGVALLQVTEAESFLASTRIDLEIEYGVHGRWPNSLDGIVHFDPAASLYMASMTIHPDELYVEAIMKSAAQGVDPAVAGKQIRFVLYPSENRWGYEYIGFTKQCDPETCDNPYEPVAEAFGLLWEPRALVEESYWYNGQWPTTDELEDVGVTTTSQSVETVISGAPALFIQAKLKESGCIAPEVAGKTLRLTFDLMTNTWQCHAGEPNGVPIDYLPVGCY